MPIGTNWGHDAERLSLKLGTANYFVYSSSSAFHFDFTGGKGVGKSSLVRRFVVGQFGEDYHGGRQSETLVFHNHEVFLC